MAKIRALKPEFFTDEKVVELTPLARILYQGLWGEACDNGHLEDRPKQLKMRILPADNCSVDDLLDEIQALQMIERDGGWISIPSFADHQKPDRRWWLCCDLPGCEKPPAEEGTSSRFGNHQRWHVARRVVDLECEFCPREPVQEGSPPDDSWTPTRRDHEEATKSARRGHVVATKRPHEHPIVHEGSLFPDGDGDVDGDVDGDMSASGEPEAAHLELINGNSKRKSPTRPIPAKWKPKEAHQAKAAEKNINLDREAEKFRGAALANDRRVSNWDQAFHNWLNTGIAKGWAEKLPPAKRPEPELPEFIGELDLWEQEDNR